MDLWPADPDNGLADSKGEADSTNPGPASTSENLQVDLPREPI